MLCQKKIMYSLWLLLAALFLSGCGSGGASAPANTGPVTSAVRTTGDLQFTLNATKSVYARGETIPLTFTVHNVGAQPAMVSYNAEPYVIQVTRGGQTASEFPSLNEDSIGGYTIAPGSSETDTINWDQTDDNEQKVPAGQYTITAFLPIRTLNLTDLLISRPPATWETFWETTYASNPITITIR